MMTTRRLICLGVVALAGSTGCDEKSDRSADQPDDSAPSCPDVADNIVSKTLSYGADTLDEYKAYRELAERECRVRAYSAEQRACAAKAASPAQIVDCGLPLRPALVETIRTRMYRESWKNLHEIVRLAFEYHARTGKRPLPVGPTPAPGSCCDGCDADESQWSGPGWQTIGFRVEGKHYASYEIFEEDGRLLVRTYGDPDCNGTFYTLTAHLILGGRALGSPAVTVDKD